MLPTGDNQASGKWAGAVPDLKGLARMICSDAGYAVGPTSPDAERFFAEKSVAIRRSERRLTITATGRGAMIA